MELFSLYGVIEEYHILDEYPSEEFTEVYWIRYRQIQNARIAKRKLDNYSFYGGNLHICYAPEYESVDETREKLQDRRKVVAAKCRQYEKEAEEERMKKSKVMSDASLSAPVAKYSSETNTSSKSSGSANKLSHDVWKSSVSESNIIEVWECPPSLSSSFSASTSEGHSINHFQVLDCRTFPMQPIHVQQHSQQDFDTSIKLPHSEPEVFFERTWDSNCGTQSSNTKRADASAIIKNKADYKVYSKESGISSNVVHHIGNYKEKTVSHVRESQEISTNQLLKSDKTVREFSSDRPKLTLIPRQLDKAAKLHKITYNKKSLPSDKTLQIASRSALCTTPKVITVVETPVFISKETYGPVRQDGLLADPDRGLLKDTGSGSLNKTMESVRKSLKKTAEPTLIPRQVKKVKLV